MINIIKQSNNVIHYSCDCGIKGMCSFKPEKREAAIVIDIRCPSCNKIKRVTLLQYSDENNKKELLANINDIDLSWVPTFNEEI